MAPGQGSLWDRYLEWRQTDKGRAAVEAPKGLVGSPETLIETLRQMQAAHIDQVILLMQAGKTAHEDVCASLELFAAEVMPQFQAAEREHQAWKEAVLCGELDLTDPSDDDLAVDGERIPGPVQLAGQR